MPVTDHAGEEKTMSLYHATPTALVTAMKINISHHPLINKFSLDKIFKYCPILFRG